MKRHYKAAHGAMFGDEQANAYGKALERLQKKQGKLTTKRIVHAARNERSPLHAVFEWDDAEAGERYRLQQARQMMNHLVLVIEQPDTEPREVKAYFSVQEAPDDDRERSYVHVEIVLEDQALRAQLIERAMREIEMWEQRHQDLQELDQIFGAIAATKERLENGAHTA